MAKDELCGHAYVMNDGLKHIYCKLDEEVCAYSRYCSHEDKCVHTNAYVNCDNYFDERYVNK